MEKKFIFLGSSSMAPEIGVGFNVCFYANIYIKRWNRTVLQRL